MNRAAFLFLITVTLPNLARAAKDPHGDGYEEAHGGSAGGLPQLDLFWFPSQIFWLGIMFVLLYTVFSGKILPRIASNLENRAQNIQSDLDSAEKMTADASAFQKSYEDSLLGARTEASQMVTDLEIEMRKTQETKQSAFLKQAEEQITSTKNKLDKAVGTSMKDIEKHIEETALLAAKNIAGIDTDGKAVKAALKAVNGNIKTKAA